ncbi:hypothetical protein NP493_316g00015 [Ridgeia piscesae]|uniref:Uncharacterized protein n=1 Tax=Ridgeia piscesae TaxID=27915 RepID=A0AAD9L6K2_RIDPI|nr:hypothetical protein NP493_316g00015 [Ridgeia piscesae]
MLFWLMYVIFIYIKHSGVSCI